MAGIGRFAVAVCLPGWVGRKGGAVKAGGGGGKWQRLSICGWVKVNVMAVVGQMEEGGGMVCMQAGMVETMGR